MLSKSHPIARRLRALRADAALRAAEGVFVAEGIHLAMEALGAGAMIDVAVVSPRLSESGEGQALTLKLQEAGILPHVTSGVTLESLQDARSPQPVVLIVRHVPPTLGAVTEAHEGSQLLVIACGVQDPGNLGALWRTADAAGATGFLATEGSASLTHPRTVRASMGAIFRLPAIEAKIDDVLEEVKSRQLRIIGADARGATSYDAADWGGPIALLLGGEGAGLPLTVVASLDLRIAVPMARGVESLSVNAAAAVLLFEAARQRRGVNRA